ncbi:MAG: hypothetical protein KKD69_01230 [Euryarchaeota archaeon]|nr:hypothetical protein [Euryarchaeota archaeon]
MARGDFDNESDIDLFIDTERRKKVDETAKKVLKSFEMSEVNEKWSTTKHFLILLISCLSYRSEKRGSE